MGRRLPHNAQKEAALLERRAFVHQLMLAGCTQAQIISFGAERGWQKSECLRDYGLIADEWQKQSEEELQSARAQAIQRIRADLVTMRIDFGETKKKKGPKARELEQATFKDIVAHERLLAQIEGTLRPVEVKVSVGDVSRRALIDAINAMSPDEMNAAIAEQRDLELRASKSK